MSDKERVLAKYPKAMAEFYFSNWIIFNGWGLDKLGSATTESKAWADASQRLEDNEVRR